MVIGEDFPKIKFNLLGMDLVEPNSFIGNTLILLAALYCAHQTRKVSDGSPFFKLWNWFYIIFGISFFTGGLGHIFFNQWGISGKYGSWMLGILAVALIEVAMVSIYPVIQNRELFQKIIFVKMLLAFSAEILVINFIDLNAEPARGMIVPTINSAIGLGTALGAMGYYYQKNIHDSFRYLTVSALVLLPSTAIQALKINPHPWFDRNDLSHLLLIAGCFLYLRSIKGYALSLETKNAPELIPADVIHPVFVLEEEEVDAVETV